MFLSLLCFDFDFGLEVVLVINGHKKSVNKNGFLVFFDDFDTYNNSERKI